MGLFGSLTRIVRGTETLRRFLASHSDSLAKKTLVKYRTTLRRFDEFLGRESRVSDLTEETLSRFRQARGQSASVAGQCLVYNEVAHLVALGRRAVKAGLLTDSPTLQSVLQSHEGDALLSDDEARALWDAIQVHSAPVAIASKPEIIKIPGVVWWSALYLTARDTGETIATLRDLREIGLCLDRQEVYIFRNGESPSVWRLEADTVAAIEALVVTYPSRKPSNCVFRWSSNPGSMWHALATFGRHAGLRDGWEFRFPKPMAGAL